MPGEAGDGPLVLPLAEFLAAVLAGQAPGHGAGVRIGPDGRGRAARRRISGASASSSSIFRRTATAAASRRRSCCASATATPASCGPPARSSRDHMFFLARCGFDAFELAPAEEPAGRARGAATASASPTRARATPACARTAGASAEGSGAASTSLVEADDQARVIVAPVDRDHDRARAGRVFQRLVAAADHGRHRDLELVAEVAARVAGDSVLAISPTRSQRFSWLMSVSCMRISITLSMLLRRGEGHQPAALAADADHRRCSRRLPGCGRWPGSGVPHCAAVLHGHAEVLQHASTKTPTSASCVTPGAPASILDQLAQRVVELPVGERLAEEAAGAAFQRLDRGESCRPAPR